MDAKWLIEDSGALFGDKETLNSLWQEIADHFYPERAHFTITRDLGYEYASHLMTSVPVMCRRDLGESFGSMLRQGEWFQLRAAREAWEDHDAKLWLDYATNVQRRVMEDRGAHFKRAAKLADHDYASFGQTAMQITLNAAGNGLLYRTWHLKDMAWRENANFEIDHIYRKWRPTARDLVATFGEKGVHANVRDLANSHDAKRKFREVEVRHCIIPGETDKMPWGSYYVDVENQHIIEDVQQVDREYVIPRWAYTGTQYSHSPAVMVALPDARLIQAMTMTLLEAGERFVNPPMVATQDVIRSDVQLFAGGVSWVDKEYDERLGDALRPISQDKGAFPVGFDMRDHLHAGLREAFYLNKLSLPPMQGHDMTATEVRERVQEYIRQALPLFEPLKEEYNEAVCDTTFEILMRNGAFGPVDDMPQSLKGREVRFQFDTPLQAAEDSERAQRYAQVLEMLQMGAQVDPTLAAKVDLHQAFEDAVRGLGTDQDWMFGEREAAKRVQEMQAQMQAQQALETAEQVQAVAGG